MSAEPEFTFGSGIKPDAVMDGMREWRTADGVYVLRIHYTADEDKRGEDWKLGEMEGMTEAAWQQEMEINFNVPKGRPYYPEFDLTRHVGKYAIEVFENRPIVCGWDFGLSPATLFAQWGPTGQLCILHEIQSWDCGIRAHGKVVASDSASFYGGYKFTDYADPAGQQRAQTDEKTCFQLLMQEFGRRMIPGPVSAVARTEAIRRLLTSTTPMGSPMLLIDPRCTWLIAAMAGGYHRKEISGGRYADEPDKDEYSHIVDCLGYIASSAVRENRRDDERIVYPVADVR